jgi:hypothetical protein
MPPLGSYMIWKTQAAAPDRKWLRRIYPRLAKWHQFWFRRRDGNGDGLLEWGSDPTPAYEFPQLRADNPALQHSAKCAMYESGLDNSPMYDGVPFNPQTSTLELADVGLNSYYAMDCDSLAHIAEWLGNKRHAAKYRAEYERMKQRINERLWDDANGIYANRHWRAPGEDSTLRVPHSALPAHDSLSPRWSPTSFLPLTAGIAPPDRAERVVRGHLLNEREFWGEFVIPSISRSDPAFPDTDYWRGRIWGPFNFLVAEGLRRYRFDDAAAQLAGKSLDLFMRNWRADGGVYENYNAVTGAGGDVWNAARLYHWGGLMAFVAMQELIDVEPCGFLRIGSVGFPDAGLKNMRIGDELYDVELGDGLRATKNGRPFLECEVRAIVRIPLGGLRNADAPIEISASQPGRLTLFDIGAVLRPARVGDRFIAPQQNAEGVHYIW